MTKFILKQFHKHFTEQKHAFVYPYPLYRVSLAADPEPEPGKEAKALAKAGTADS